MLICPSCGKPSRIGRAPLPGGGRARICKNCDEIVDKES
ncbi:MAG: hypothetical protein ACRDFS_04675 [Chloroflexota bacterium]